MNLLFVSKLNGDLSQGPNNSVPEQVKAQSEFDTVFWYNLADVSNCEWDKEVYYYYDTGDYPRMTLDDLPHPFCHPDLIIFEELYKYRFDRIVEEAIKRKIPYIIVPRSQMTEGAQSRKKYKKMIGNMVYYNRFIKHASAIQYLTENEKKESSSWKVRSFVVPNGTKVPDVKNHVELNDGVLRFVYIGRIRLYQKGLERMISAVERVSKIFREENCRLDLYGSDFNGAVEVFNRMINDKNIQDIITIHGPVYGKEKEEILLNSDVFIMTSEYEGMPMGLIEALAFGLPAVVTEGTNMARIIENSAAGWNAGKTQDTIEKAFLNAICNKASFTVYRQNAIELAKSYEWRSLALLLHNCLSEIVRK